MAVMFSLASPHTHQVPQVNFPHTEPAIKVEAVKITPDFAFANAKESYFGFSLKRDFRTGIQDALSYFST